jgi:hypothetical protein
MAVTVFDTVTASSGGGGQAGGSISAIEYWMSPNSAGQGGNLRRLFIDAQ